MCRVGVMGFIALLLSACTAEPELALPGQVYQQPRGFFSCAVPGPEQSFRGASELSDGGAMIVFRDQVERQVSLEVNAAGIHGIYQEEYWAKGRAAQGVWRMSFERGFVSLLQEGEIEVRPGFYARMGMQQFPYYDPAASYMGRMLAENYRLSDAPPPIVRVVANLMVEETHYTAIYSVPARWFLPKDTPLREVEVIRTRLLERRQAIWDKVTEAFGTWLATCDLTPFARAQVPYRPPSEPSSGLSVSP